MDEKKKRNTAEFKLDLIRLFERYEEIDDDRLRNATYQVVDYYGEDNMARKHSTRYDDEFDSEESDDPDEDDANAGAEENEDGIDEQDVIPSTDGDDAKTPEELRR